jgi:hypothetical protein
VKFAGKNLVNIPDIFTSPSYLGFLGQCDTKRIMNCLHWQSLLAKPSATATRDSHATVTTILALTTLGGATQIGLFLFFVTPPKVAKASSHLAVAVIVVSYCRWWYPAKLCRWKHSFSSFCATSPKVAKATILLDIYELLLSLAWKFSQKNFTNVCVALWNPEAV